MGQDVSRMLWAQFWQVSLLVLCVAIAARWLGRNRPHLAHALWLVVLFKALTPPLWASPSGVFSWLQSPGVIQESLEQESPAESPGAADVPQSPTVTIASNLVADDLAFAPSETLPEEWDAGSPSLPDAHVAEMHQVIENEPEESLPLESNAPDDGLGWKQWLLGVWILGALGSLALALARWVNCWREIRRAPAIDDPLAQKLLDDLRRRLRVRRNVRLIISQSRIGPAVLGLIRPTVLVPLRIIEGKPKADLEPILAHELVHIRRGDLWVGWLQILAEAAWWFHPLVRLAGRTLRHEAERSCDEEVLAELGIKPARYARALLDVLELKHVLRAVPALPGVKPVEITSKRLERIMQLGQGCRKRTPWWCWLVMLLTLAVTLPGAAFVAEAKDKAKGQNVEEVSSANNSTFALRQSYKVGDVLEKCQAEFGIGEEEARTHLASHLKLAVGPLWQAERFVSSPTQAGTPSIRIRGNSLTVYHTPIVQEAIADQLLLLKEHGFQQIVIEARIITARRALMEEAVPIWEMVLPGAADGEHQAAGAVDRPHPQDKANSPNTARMLVEKSLPMRLALLDDVQLRKLLEACQSDARANLLFCPKVTVSNGQSATIQDTTERPFVVNISGEGQPGVRVVREGITLKLRPVLEGQRIRLESEITLSDIRGVEVLDLHDGPKAENPLKVQVPEVATTRIHSVVKVRSGGSVVLGGFRPTKDFAKGDEELFVSLRVIRLGRDEESQPRPVPPMVSEAATGKLHFGVGVNSDAGVTGSIAFDEKDFQSVAIDPPTDEEVLQALEANDKRQKPKPGSSLEMVQRKNVVITKEKVAQRASSPRVYPMVGVARVHTASFKCTVMFDEVQTSEYPIPFKRSNRKCQEVLIDKSRMVPLQNPPQPVPEPYEILPSAHYLEDDVQYFPPGRVAPPPFDSRKDWANIARRRNASEAEKSIQQKLAETVSLSFKDTPLDEALKQISQQTALNLVIDDPGLAEEGLTKAQPVTLDVKSIKVSTALRVMLEPLRLCYAVEDEVLKVTSKSRLESELLIVATYAVADLVIPVPQRVRVDLRGNEDDAKAWAPKPVPQKLAPPETDFDGLSQLITSTIQPDSWAERGGIGSLRSFEPTLSLVVRQTPKAHEELRGLLEQLRALQDVQVSLSVCLFEAECLENNDLAKRLATGKPVALTPGEAEALRLSLRTEPKGESQVAPKVTLFNGQTSEMIFPSDDEAGLGVELCPVISSDRRFVRLGISTNIVAGMRTTTNAQSLLNDGHSVLLNLTKSDGETLVDETKLLLVTPTMVIQEEEEELLGVEESR